MNETEQQLRDLGRKWVQAEISADVQALELLTTDDFTLVGPLGFVIAKPEWLQRYRSGALRFETLEWDELVIREYGDTAVIIGRQSQLAYYENRPNPGQFRATHVAMRQGREWLLASMHIGPLVVPA
jgi:ketosteroid isomerase-like protein